MATPKKSNDPKDQTTDEEEEDFEQKVENLSKLISSLPKEGLGLMTDACHGPFEDHLDD